MNPKKYDCECEICLKTFKASTRTAKMCPKCRKVETKSPFVGGYNTRAVGRKCKKLKSTS